MELTFECPGCHQVGRVASVETAGAAECRRCRARRELRPGSFDGPDLRACPWCATDEFYTQKDFPQGLGLAIVVLGFAASTVFWYQDRPIPALSVLLVSALADMALFYLVPDVTICYRCLSQFRGPGANPGRRLSAFDLAVGERYRQERLRVAEHHRGRPQGDAPPPTLSPAPPARPSDL